MRLRRGDFGAEKVYDDDPVAVARRFAAAGAEWIHTVDLDAARTGEPANLGVIEAICAAVPSRVQAGGGVRTVEAAGALLASGVERVVVGTAAIEHPAVVDDLCTLHAGRVAVGLDARADAVAVRGWTEDSGATLLDAAVRFESSGVAALVVTAIERDGTLEGPGVDELRAVLAATGVPVIASGGIGSLDDLRALRALQVAGRTLAGAIVGTAIYEGRVPLEDALAVGYGRGDGRVHQGGSDG